MANEGVLAVAKLTRATMRIALSTIASSSDSPLSIDLISEIILVSVDFELLSQGFKYVRNIDDYTKRSKSKDFSHSSSIEYYLAKKLQSTA